MTAGKFGSASVTITLDDASGTPRIITGFIMDMSGIKITSNMEQSNSYGDSWEESLPSGVSKVDPITLGGFWDTTLLTGPHASMGVPDASPQSTTRTLVVVFGDSKTFTVECFLESYEVIGNNGNLTKFSAVLRPTGAGVWS